MSRTETPTDAAVDTSSDAATDAATARPGRPDERGETGEGGGSGENAVVTVRYWAAAKAAAGVAEQSLPGDTVGRVLAAAVAQHPDLERVLAVASVLLDGSPADRDQEIPAGATLEILPPFAGG